MMEDAKPIARSAIVADEQWDVAVEKVLASFAPGIQAAKK